jgi:hypothetical protein
MVVKTWGTGVAEEVGKPLPDCGRCRRPDSVNERKAWGCDAPTKKAVFVTSCSRCFGGDPDCADCEDGLIEYHRCPSAVAETFSAKQRRAAGRAVRAYIQLDSRSVLPNAGGFEEQSPQFAQIVDVIDHERGRWERIRYNKRKQDMARTKAKPTSKRR